MSVHGNFSSAKGLRNIPSHRTMPKQALPLGERIIQWVISVSSVGLVLSMLIHVLIVLSAALVTVGVAGMGSRGSGGGDYSMTATSDRSGWWRI